MLVIFQILSKTQIKMSCIFPSPYKFISKNFDYFNHLINDLNLDLDFRFKFRFRYF